MVDFHDPRGAIATPIEAYELGVDLRGHNDPSLALLANGFPDSEAFLELLAEVLQEQLPSLHVSHFNKGNASIPAPAEMLDAAAASVGVIAAYGH
jgi:hypothetical protein